MTEDMQGMLESAAFPFTHNPDGKSITATGMTLRDYFAAKAMQSFISAWVLKSEYPNTDVELAEHAYAMADAMLEVKGE